MEHTPHVLLVGKGAEAFAARQGLQMEDPSYFFTQKRWNAYLKVKAKKARSEEHGTVGAVALDKYGNLAAGTSTGGITYKMPRVLKVIVKWPVRSTAIMPPSPPCFSSLSRIT